MPYIRQIHRTIIEDCLSDDSLNWVPSNAGDLNFVVSTFIANYLRVNGLNYENLNAMIGALECAKLELNRVIIGPYEDLKIAENGPVYDDILPSNQY
jgi:hypothetical protein